MKGVVAGLHHAVFDGNRAIVEIFLHNGSVARRAGCQPGPVLGE